MTTRTEIPLDLIMSKTDDVVLVKDQEGRHRYVNEAGLAFLGMPANDVIGKTDDDLFPGGRGRDIMEIDRSIMQAGERNETTDRIVTPKGEFFFQTTKWPWIENDVTRGILAIVRDITDEHVVKQKLIESEDLYRTTLSSISDAVFVTDDFGDFTWIGPNVSNIFGYSIEAVRKIGNISKILEPVRIDRDILSAEKEIKDIEVRVADNNGNLHDLLVNIKEVSIGNGTTLYTCRDITERVAAMEESEKEKTRLQAILANSPAPIFMKDAEGRYQLTSAKHEEITGMSSDQILGKTDQDLYPPKVAQSIQQNDKIVLETQVPLTTEDNVGTSSDMRTYLSTKFPVQEGTGQEVSLGGIAIDITDLKEAQSALAESESKYREFVEETEDLVTQVDSNGVFTFVNSQAEKYLGLTPEQCIGRLGLDFVHPDDRNDTLQHFNKYIQRRAASGQFDNRQQSLDGTVRHVNWISHFFYDDSGTLTQINSTARDVTDLTIAEIALRESEQRFSAAFANAPIGMALVGPDGRWLRVNRSLCNIVGYTEEELLSKTFQDITHPDDLTVDLEYVRQMLEGEIKAYQMEKRYFHKSGKVIWILLSVSLVRDDNDQPLHFISQVLDISERKHFEVELRESEDRYRTVFESGADVFLVFDLEGNLVDVNQKACETYGYTRAEMLTLSGRDIVAPEYQHMFKNFSETQIGDWFKTESVDVRKDGSRFEIQIHGTRLMLAGVERLLANVRDITEQRANQKALAASEARFRNLTESTKDWIWEIDQTFAYTYCSPQVEEILGYKSEQLIGKRITDYMSPEERSEVLEQSTAIAKDQSPIENFEFTVLHKDGQKVILETNGVPITDQAGQYSGYRGINRDITERHTVRVALEKSEVRFRNLTETTSDWIWEVDENVIYTYCSPAVTDILGRTPEDIVGTSPFDLMPPDEAKRVAEFFEPIAKARKPFSGLENINLHSDGTKVVLDTSAVPILGEGGKLKGYRGIDRDITEKKGAELELRKEKELGDALTGIEMMLSSTLELGDVLSGILTEVVSTLGASTACLDMHDEKMMALSHCDEGATPQDIHANDRIANNRTLVIESAKLLANRNEGYLGIPVVRQSKLIGVISVLWDEPNMPGRAEIDFCKKLGFLLSLAIENSRLYTAERDIAGTLQASLLGTPDSIEGVEFGLFYRSATEAATVGGDFYDLFELGMDRVGVVMGDVSGKGIRASTLTSLVKHTLRAHAFDGERPEVIMKKTSEAVLRSSDPNNFVTIFFGILDTKSGILEYCCGGHPRPIYISADEAKPMEVTISPAAGMLPGLEFRHGTLALEPGSKLLLYTDGVTEARPAGGEMYGEGRLVDCLNSLLHAETKKLPPAVFENVSNFAGGILPDDVALMSLQLSRP